MRFGPTDKFWVVVDATRNASDGENVFQASLRDLELQFKGGLTMAQNPTLFTDEEGARMEAFGRLTAMRAKRAIEQQVAEGRIHGLPQRLEILDGAGKVLFEADLQ
jgi:hypothetical protein